MCLVKVKINKKKLLFKIFSYLYIYIYYIFIKYFIFNIWKVFIIQIYSKSNISIKIKEFYKYVNKRKNRIIFYIILYKYTIYTIDCIITFLGVSKNVRDFYKYPKLIMKSNNKKMYHLNNMTTFKNVIKLFLF